MKIKRLPPELEPEHLDAMLQRAKVSLEADDYAIIEAMAARINTIRQAVREERIPTRGQLRKMLGAPIKRSKQDE